jgi:exportin-2 (importin alpha re-exporter)
LVLKIDLWLVKGNVPALVRLVSAVIARGSAELVKNSQVEPILGIFKHLFSSKANEVQAFEILECILNHFPQ